MIKTEKHRLIVFEGIDLTGKTTNCKKAANLIDELAQNNKELCEKDYKDITQKARFMFEDEYLDKKSFLQELQGKRNDNAILLDSLLKKGIFKYPEMYNSVESIEDSQDRFYAHLMRLAFKSRIMEVLLPYFHVICDRYYGSVYGRAKAMGISSPSPKPENLTIFAPDLTFVLTVDEEERQARIRTRAAETISPIDSMVKTPGGYHDITEKALFELFPDTIIDSTRKNIDNIFSIDIAPHIEKIIK